MIPSLITAFALNALWCAALALLYALHRRALDALRARARYDLEEARGEADKLREMARAAHEERDAALPDAQRWRGYLEGLAAQEAGRPQDACPYRWGSPGAEGWEHGWEAGAAIDGDVAREDALRRLGVAERERDEARRERDEALAALAESQTAARVNSESAYRLCDELEGVCRERNDARDALAESRRLAGVAAVEPLGDGYGDEPRHLRFRLLLTAGTGAGEAGIVAVRLTPREVRGGIEAERRAAQREAEVAAGGAA